MSSSEVRQKTVESGYNNLLDICLDLHMMNNGSYQDMTKEKYEFLVSILKQADEEWFEGNSKYKIFDDAVRNLIKATLEECDRFFN